MATPENNNENNGNTEIDQLFRGYAEGDARAFSRLYDLVSPKVWGFVIKRVPSRALAEEIFQEAWAKIHRTRESFDPKFPALPWIFTITRSVWLDALRRQQSRPEVPVASDALEVLAGAGKVESDRVNEAKGTWEEIEPGLAPEERELLDDRYLKEWSFEEIAKKLNVSESGVRQRISRILRRIRSQKV